MEPDVRARSDPGRMASVSHPTQRSEDSPDEARTFYERPWLDRWTGRYTLEWATPSGPRRLRVHNRLVDLQGRRPSWYSVARIPLTLWTWFESRWRKLLARPYPYLAWDAVRYLDRIVTPGMHVLEVGGGNSTLWLLERGAHVHTIEPSAEWIAELRQAAFDRLGREAANRWTVVQATGNAAVEAIRQASGGPWDLVLVDPQGQTIPRIEALLAARPQLRPGGWLMLDNSDHPLQAGALEALGIPTKVVTGYGAMCLVVTQTAFWRP